MDAIMMMEASELIFERCLKKSANANPHLALHACVDKCKCWLTVKSAEYSLQALAETLVNNYSGNAM